MPAKVSFPLSLPQSLAAMNLPSATMDLAILDTSYFQKSYVIFSFFVYVCPCENLWSPHEFRHSQRPESTSDPLGLELQKSVSQGAGNHRGSWVPCRGSKCS